MIYNSDTIPAKIYYKILQTGDVTLLTNKKKRHNEEDLKEVWLDIENDFFETDKNAKSVLDIQKYVDHFKAKQKTIEITVRMLEVSGEDSEMLEILKEHGYSYNGKEWGLFLNKVKSQNKNLSIIIDNWESKLPKPKKETEHTPIEDIILSYAVITGAGFISTNDITKKDFDALVRTGNEKIKALKNNGKNR